MGKEQTKTQASVPAVAQPASGAVAVLSNYAISALTPQALTEIIAENMGATGITEFDLDRIKVPSGGGLSFTVNTLEGEREVSEIEGVIVYAKDARAYWKDNFETTGGGVPPDCSSVNGLHGQGEPGGECAKCPLAQFGSARKSNGTEARGQACKAMKLLFMVRPGDLLPLVVAAPPTSVRPLKQYMLRLASNAKPYTSVVTKLTLTRERNKDGINYSQINPTVVATLTPEEHDRIRSYGAMFRPQMEAQGVDVQDFDVNDNDV